MAKKVILGSDVGRDAMKQKINDNFTELYNKDASLEEQLEDLATKVIAESESNENGSYVKFEDGTMICFRRRLETVNIPVGGKYVFSWIFPATFYSSPIIVGELNLLTGDANALSNSLKILSNTPGATSIRNYIINAGKDEWGSIGLSATQAYYSGIAIGRWKV